MAKNNVLIIGSGGREHAMAWNLATYARKNIFFTGRNAGMFFDGFNQIDDVKVTKDDGFFGVKKIIDSKKIDYVIVGPEAPLADGIVDSLNKSGFNNVFGPREIPAKLESDKFFSYDINRELSIPQAKGWQASNLLQAKKILIEYYEALTLREEKDDGVVLKARGLHAGKGVVVCDSIEDAIRTLPDFEQKYGSRILISERLYGPEFSAFAFSDGKKALPLGLYFKDHKRLEDGDKGPNTGGMGAYSVRQSSEIDYFMKNIVFEPLISEMSKIGHPFKGIIYAGMMNTARGPKVLEYNVRMGDPECQPAMMLIENFAQIVEEALSPQGFDETLEVELREKAACCIVMASNGYPDSAKTGYTINGLDKLENPNIKIFHAGTKEVDRGIIASGGRVLGVTATGPTVLDASQIAYKFVREIDSKNQGTMQYRTDIGSKYR